MKTSRFRLGAAGVLTALALSAQAQDFPPAQIKRGAELFAANCAVCHGDDGKGKLDLGSPNLTDRIWLYGSDEATIIETITKGRNNVMPAHKDFLGEARVHVLAGYVYGLSNSK